MTTTRIRHAADGAFERVEPGIFVRDLGIGDLTGGDLTAQVVHLEPEGARVEHLHRHEEGFSLAYVLKGWLDVEFQQIGVHHLGPRTVIPAFNGPMHRELDCGDDFHLLLLVTRRSMSGDDRQNIVVLQERDARLSPGPGGWVLRDFGLKEMTGGRMAAYALHAGRGAARAEGSTSDAHARFAFVADGWVEFTYSDVGAVRLEKGAMAFQPPDVRRTEIAHGDEAVVVEVALAG